MFIVSKFHDFYDVGSSYGIDKTCVYKRKVDTVTIKGGNNFHWRDESNGADLIYDESRPRTVNQREYNFRTLAIGFCGVIYPCIQINMTHCHITVPYLFYNADDYMNFVTTHNLRKAKRRYSFYSQVEYTAEYAKRFFDGSFNVFNELFFDHKSPIFVAEYSRGGKFKITFNDKLKKFKFYQVKDSFTAFQEVYMYLSGVIGNTEVDMVQISDKDQLYKKGFDDKSFKTSKGAPDRKRKKKT